MLNKVQLERIISSVYLPHVQDKLQQCKNIRGGFLINLDEDFSTDVVNLDEFGKNYSVEQRPEAYARGLLNWYAINCSKDDFLVAVSIRNEFILPNGPELVQLDLLMQTQLDAGLMTGCFIDNVLYGSAYVQNEQVVGYLEQSLLENIGVWNDVYSRAFFEFKDCVLMKEFI